ncbi:lipoprotein [Streptomyces sp. KAU_LT]|uniref:lipoprotein n=1 Tax=Streptomyces sp. KAU_LT TaxID=3046669 RepID=UPI0024B6C24A|nr:lipoprotein [Streptomyces sp. KAU_LT]MDI9835512.1 lipoprotein [Streptomyces sp. KAU_LT]
MRVGAGRMRRGVALAVLLGAVLTGCSGGSGEEPEEDGRASASAEASGAGAGAAKSGGSVGAAGSACELPVTFDIAASWKPKAVETKPAGGDDELARELADALLHQGPVTAACEIDAKPAGNIGFLRVWTGEPGDADARSVLKEFVAAEKGAEKAVYRTFEAADGVTGAEVTYQYTSKILEETKEERALAVTTKRGPVVLHLGGMDTEEHRAMLPAYELARRTLRVG